MKAIIQAYSPKEVERIARGEQTIKVCKTAPKEVPFKVYMYCTKDGYMYRCRFDENRLAIPELWNGKVVGEYVCDKVIKYDYQTIACAKYEVNGADVKEQLRYNAGACLNSEEMYSLSNGKDLRGLHIPAVKFYDKPKALGEFVTVKCTHKSGSCSDCKIKPDCIKQITRPPQSWQYVIGDR